ncbi:MAG TPA: hypothetical protein VIK47_03055 [Kiloniellales bacterium]
MGDVVFFPPKADLEGDFEIDLLTAVDAAIRDLREIGERCDAIAKRQAEECRLMLERAYFNAAG